MKRAKSKKSSRMSTVILIFVFIAGLTIMLYPTISDYVNSRNQSRAIIDYNAVLEGLEPSVCEEYILSAEDYNNRLAQLDYPLMYADSLGDYSQQLDLSGNGIMGYVTIEKINVQLPIYHGTSEAVLDVAVGHLEGSSLPIGGKGTHAVLSAHRGLPTAKLFTNLNKLEIGDSFTVTVLNQTMVYEVDQVLTVLPEDVEPLYVVDGKDYCTLVTCTPYGINSHRLLVRGVRVDNLSPDEYVPADAYLLDSVYVAPLVAAPILAVLLVFVLAKYRRKDEIIDRIVGINRQTPLETSKSGSKTR